MRQKSRATIDRPVPLRAAVPGWRSLIGWWRAALARRRQRLALAALDDHLLWDIGVTRDEARVVTAKGWWR